MKKYFFLLLGALIFNACSLPQLSLQESTTLAPLGKVLDSFPKLYKEPYPVSLEALMEKEFTGENLSLVSILARTESYTRYRISYEANGFTLSGIMNIPRGEGPYPLLILNHGYIDPAVYTNGRGLKREQDYLAKQGYAVLHPDYRNHAFSDKDPENALRFRLGYTEDVIGAVLAVQNSSLPELNTVEKTKVGMLGHSMGGGITQNVLTVRPNLVQAAVLYAPVSSSAQENLEQYFLRNNNRNSVVNQIYEQHGSPENTPEFWEGISPKNYFYRITAPIQVHIGTRDDSTPPQWSYDIEKQLLEANKEVELHIYENEGHEYGPQWTSFMERSSAFFNTHLKSID